MVLGASFDTPEENRAFAEAEGFAYRLLSDAGREVGSRYGVTRPPDGDYPDFPKRFTFLIDPEGIVRKVYEVSDVAGHPGEVLDDIRRLGAG